MIWKTPFIGSHNGAVPPVGGSPVENVFLLEDLGVEGALCKFDPLMMMLVRKIMKS